MAKLINISGGPKGVNTLAGLVVVVLAGAAIDATEVSDVEAADLVAVDWFELDASDDAHDAGDGLDALKVDDLKALATAEAIDLGEATKKAEIVAAIRAARAAKE